MVLITLQELCVIFKFFISTEKKLQF